MDVSTPKAGLPLRRLGERGPLVSVLGFGASPLGGVFEDIDEAVGVAAVHEAFKLGINFFDTSPFYGATRSEAVLGRALRSLPRADIVVATKVGRYGPEEFDFSRARVLAEFEHSLKRLQLDYVDILQCHDVEFGDLQQVARETIPALRELVAAGKARHLGVTGLPLQVYRRILVSVPPGTLDVALSYCHYCLNDASLLDLLPDLEHGGLGVINASPLSMGLLTAAGPPAWHPAPPALKAAARRAAQRASAAGCDIAHLALSWALKEPRIASTLVGMATPELVRANVAAARQALGLDDNPVAAAEAVALEAVFEELKPVVGMSWPSGKQENN